MVKSARRGCWTCKDRRVACDKTSPVCHRCTKSKRACGGYGVRLSWPDQRESHHSLSKTISLAYNSVSGTRVEIVEWVNTCVVDVTLHLVAKHDATQGWSGLERRHLNLPSLPRVIPRMPEVLVDGDMELLCYFESTVSKALPVLGFSRERLTQSLLRLALDNHTHVSKAVLLAILSMSEHHRGGDVKRASCLKYKALRALIAASSPSMNMSPGIEHMAAGLILGLVELQKIGEGCEWVGQVCGASDLIRALPKGRYALRDDSDASTILAWVYQFHTLARFSFRHWRTGMIRATAPELGFKAGSDGCAAQWAICQTSFSKELPIISVHVHKIVQLLSQVFDTLLSASDQRYHTAGYQQRLDDLSVQLEHVPLDADHESLSQDDSLNLEATRFAGLIYHERVSRNFSGASTKLDTWRSRALSIFRRMDSCPSFFVLFIIGCETHLDEERLELLSLFARIEQTPHFNTLLVAKGLVQTAWIQHDLHTDDELGYILKLNLVLSSRVTVPSFM